MQSYSPESAPDNSPVSEKRPARIIAGKEAERFRPLVATIDSLFATEFGSTVGGLTYIFSQTNEEHKQRMNLDLPNESEMRNHDRVSYYFPRKKEIVIHPDTVSVLKTGNQYGPLLSVKLSAIEEVVHERAHAETDTPYGTSLANEVGEAVVQIIAHQTVVNHAAELAKQDIPQQLLDTYKKMAISGHSLGPERMKEVVSKLKAGMEKAGINIADDTSVYQWLKERFNNQGQGEIVRAYLGDL